MLANEEVTPLKSKIFSVYQLHLDPSFSDFLCLVRKKVQKVLK